jgi:hypothetical protein
MMKWVVGKEAANINNTVFRNHGDAYCGFLEHRGLSEKVAAMVGLQKTGKNSLGS